MADLVMKRNDTWPPLEATLRDANGPIDLTDAREVRVLLRLSVDDLAVSELVDIDADPTTGRVAYEWASGDLDEVGEYNGEFEITWTNGGIETVPNEAYFTLSVVEDLGP